jgi:predicted nucleic acid-binding Zn ribbon protein
MEMAKRSNEKTIGEAFREMLESYRMHDKYEEMKITSLWPDIAGTMISKHTEQVFIKNGKLYLKVDSPALKNELLYMTSGILSSVNEKAGKEIISEVVLI